MSSNNIGWHIVEKIQIQQCTDAVDGLVLLVGVMGSKQCQQRTPPPSTPACVWMKALSREGTLDRREMPWGPCSCEYTHGELVYTRISSSASSRSGSQTTLAQSCVQSCLSDEHRARMQMYNESLIESLSPLDWWGGSLLQLGHESTQDDLICPRQAARTATKRVPSRRLDIAELERVSLLVDHLRRTPSVEVPLHHLYATGHVDEDDGG